MLRQIQLILSNLDSVHKNYTQQILLKYKCALWQSQYHWNFLTATLIILPQHTRVLNHNSAEWVNYLIAAYLVYLQLYDKPL